MDHLKSGLYIIHTLFWVIFLFFASYLRGEEPSSPQPLNNNFLNKKIALNYALTEALKENQNNSTPLFAENEKIARLFWALNELPLARLYLERALIFNPRDLHLQEQLKQLEGILEPERQSQPPSLLNQWQIPFSSFEIEMAFLILSLLAFLGLFLYFSFPFRWLKIMILPLFFLALTLLILLLYRTYFAPIEGIVIESTSLYQNPSFQAPLIKREPIFAGGKIQILDDSASGEWLKISNQDHQIGFIPAKAVRII